MSHSAFRPGRITRVRSSERGDFLQRPVRRTVSAHDVRATAVLADFRARRDRRSSAIQGFADTSREDAVQYEPKSEEIENSLKGSSFTNYVQKTLNIYHARLRLTPYYTGRLYNTESPRPKAVPSRDLSNEMKWRNVPVLINLQYDLKLYPTFNLTPSLGPRCFYSAQYWNNKRVKETQKNLEISRIIPATTYKTRA